MRLEDLKTRCKEQNIQYMYGFFKEKVSCPHLVAKEIETVNFLADNKVYCRIGKIQLDLTMEYIDFDLINKVENKILHDVCWNKTDETYLTDEEVWQISYFFEI